MAFSGSLFSEGINHLSSNAPFPNELAEIQSTLLILQHAISVVMGYCLELGLYRGVCESV